MWIVNLNFLDLKTDPLISEGLAPLVLQLAIVYLLNHQAVLEVSHVSRSFGFASRASS